MLIGINLLYLIPGRVGGTETYARELIPTLARANQLILFCGRETAPTFRASKNIKVVKLPFNSRNRVARILIEQTVLPLLCTKYKIDVLFSLGYSAPCIYPNPSVVTIHDLNWYYHPSDFGWLNRIIWQLLTRVSAATSNHIITDSQASAQSLLQVLKIHPSRVTSILHATPRKLVVKSKKRVNPYIFTVVAGYPHKNVQTLLKAFAKVAKTHKKIDLVICGLGGKADSHNSHLIATLGLSKRVHLLGYIERQELAAYYQGAKIFVFPSAYEGFGYPVIEAMSYGVPVISSNAFALSEVVGSGGILVDPYDVKSYVRAMTQLLASPKMRRELIEKGTKRASQLKWVTTARHTLVVLEKVAKL